MFFGADENSSQAQKMAATFKVITDEEIVDKCANNGGGLCDPSTICTLDDAGDVFCKCPQNFEMVGVVEDFNKSV